MTQHISPILPSADEKPVYVNNMFARIAPTYDLMNRLMAMGQDPGWRRLMLEHCNLPPRGRLLDIGTGTGDIAYEALRRYPGVEVVGSDFTYEMMAAGVGKAPDITLPFVQGDTYALPFPDNTFDAVVSGFMMRNVVDRVAAFQRTGSRHQTGRACRLPGDSAAVKHDAGTAL